jgi:hypothetical protein
LSLLYIPGLSEADQATLTELLNQLDYKTPRNLLKEQYYSAKYVLRDLGVSVPPKFRNFEAVLGWPAKAVDSLSRRCNLEGFVIPGTDVANMGIDEVWLDNRMEIESSMAHDSAMIHSCSFVCTILGDEQSGEPPVIMMAKSAFDATGLWDSRRRELSAALSIIERSEGLTPLTMVMYLPDRVLIMSRDVDGGKWRVDERRHSLGHVPVELLPFNPRLNLPFGRSRITRSVMSITDSALRTVVRSEIGAEFYTAPQRWALNVPAAAFEDGGWSAVLGRMIALEPPLLDDELDPAYKPELGQFPQASMQPHSDQLRQWATLFAGETNIPVSSLGVVQDNPSSAEAIYAAKEDLIVECEHANRVFGRGWVGAMRNAVMLRDGLSEETDELKKLQVVWRDPSTPSRASSADAMAKTVATLPWIAESEVTLEKFGFSRTDIDRLREDKRKASVTQLLDSMRATAMQAQRPSAGQSAAPEQDNQQVTDARNGR